MICRFATTTFLIRAAFHDQGTIRALSLRLHHHSRAFEVFSTRHASASHNTSLLAFGSTTVQISPSFSFSSSTFSSLTIPSCALDRLAFPEKHVGLVSLSPLWHVNHYRKSEAATRKFYQCGERRASLQTGAAERDRVERPSYIFWLHIHII